MYLLTGGGPADATQTLAVLVYEKAFWALEMGYAAAIGVLMLIFMLILSVIYLSVYRSNTNADAAK